MTLCSSYQSLLPRQYQPLLLILFLTFDIEIPTYLRVHNNNNNDNKSCCFFMGNKTTKRVSDRKKVGDIEH